MLHIQLPTYFKTKHDYSDQIANSLAALFKKEHLQKQEVLLNIGERWKQVHYIEKGLLRLYYNNEDGKEFNKGFFAETQLVWPMAPSARNEDSLFSIAAVEPTILHSIAFTDFKAFITDHANWEAFALPYVEELADQKYLREHQFLTYDAKNRYLQLSRELGSIFNRLPDYHIASYLGITHVALSRIKAQLHNT